MTVKDYKELRNDEDRLSTLMWTSRCVFFLLLCLFYIIIPITEPKDGVIISLVEFIPTSLVIAYLVGSIIGFIASYFPFECEKWYSALFTSLAAHVVTIILFVLGVLFVFLLEQIYKTREFGNLLLFIEFILIIAGVLCMMILLYKIITNKSDRGFYVIAFLIVLVIFITVLSSFFERGKEVEVIRNIYYELGLDGMI